MTTSRNGAEHTMTQVKSVEESLRTIDSFVSDIDESLALISSAAAQQAIATNEISQSINKMTGISNQTLTNAAETTSSSLKINTLGEDVNQLLSQFKI